MNGPRVAFVLSALLITMSIAVLAVYGTDEPGIRALIRATARTSLALFLAAFAASSLRVFVKTPATAWMLRNRRTLGLSFVVSHAIHLAAIADVALRWPHPFMEESAQPLTLVGGGAGYVGLVLMALTSWDGAVRRLGAQRWRALHLAGSWILWIIFAQSYAGRAVAAPWPYALAMVALLGVAMLRFAAWRRKRTSR